MANKYSEELFGAIDEILKKRLEKLNKDSTILCSVEDNSEATEGKYIVLNNALRFVAYSENTDYQIGQNVWVLVPDGDYNNTKIIIGKYVDTDTGSFTWVDPFSNFVNITGNLAENFTGQRYELVANHPVITQINIGNVVSGAVNTSALRGLDRIAVAADFGTMFSGVSIPTAGNYGLHFQIITDKENISLDFALDVNNMNGNPYGQNGTLFEQKLVYDFDPEEYGNIKEINCTFFQDQEFICSEGMYNLDTEGNLISSIPDIFMTNLQVMLGYSSNKISDSTALLSTMGSTLFTVELSDNIRRLSPRFVYKNANGTFAFINTYDDYIHAEELNSNLKDLKIRLYYQNLSVDNYEPRAGHFYHEA